MTRDEFVRMQMRAHLRGLALKELERGSSLMATTSNLSREKMVEPAQISGDAADDAFETAEIILKIADEISEAPL